MPTLNISWAKMKKHNEPTLLSTKNLLIDNIIKVSPPPMPDWVLLSHFTDVEPEAQ